MDRIPRSLKLIFFSLLPLFVLLAAAEILFRFYVYERIGEDYDYVSRWMDARFADNEFIKTETIDGRQYYFTEPYPVRYYYDVHYEGGRYVLKDKPPNAYRFFSFGGSSTAGSPFGHWGSFSRFLQDQLVEMAHPGAPVETINFGTSGGTVARARYLLDRVARLEPDAIIVYAGHNEICDVSLYQPATGRRLKTLSQFLSDHSYTFRSLSVLYRKTFPPAIPEPDRAFDIHQCPFSEIRIEGPEDLQEMKNNYRKNLLEIIRKAAEHGIDVVLVNQVANVFMPPRDFDGRKVHARAAELRERLAEGEVGAVRVKAERILRGDPNNPVALYYLGLTDLIEGRIEQGRRNLMAAVENDRYPRRFRPSYSAILREFAEEYEHVFMVDITKKLHTLIGEDLVDGRLIYDRMHPNIELNKYIANQIVEQYFVANAVRADIFDYERFDPGKVWRPFGEEAYYGLICKRYYQIDDWKECLETARAEFYDTRKPHLLDAHRRAMRLWENLFYYGLATGDRAALQEARRIFPAPSTVALP